MAEVSLLFTSQFIMVRLIKFLTFHRIKSNVSGNKTKDGNKKVSGGGNNGEGYKGNNGKPQNYRSNKPKDQRPYNRPAKTEDDRQSVSSDSSRQSGSRPPQRTGGPSGGRRPQSSGGQGKPRHAGGPGRGGGAHRAGPASAKSPRGPFGQGQTGGLNEQLGGETAPGGEEEFEFEEEEETSQRGRNGRGRASRDVQRVPVSAAVPEEDAALLFDDDYFVKKITSTPGHWHIQDDDDTDFMDRLLSTAYLESVKSSDHVYRDLISSKPYRDVFKAPRPRSIDQLRCALVPKISAPRDSKGYQHAVQAWTVNMTSFYHQ